MYQNQLITLVQNVTSYQLKHNVLIVEVGYGKIVGVGHTIFMKKLQQM